MDLMNLQANIASLIELKIKNHPFLDQTESRAAFIQSDIEKSMRTYQSLKDRFALEYNDWLAFTIGGSTSGILGYLLTKSAKVKKYKYVNLIRYFMPVFAGSSCTYTHRSLNVNTLFRLKENCKECFQFRVILSTAVFPVVQQFYLTTLISWMGETVALNYAFFNFKPKETYLQLVKRFCFAYFAHVRQLKAFNHLAVAFLFGAVFSYLLAIEEQREFTIIFTKYYQDLILEKQLIEENRLDYKNATI